MLEKGKVIYHFQIEQLKIIVRMSKVMEKSSGLIPPIVLSGVIQESNPDEDNW